MNDMSILQILDYNLAEGQVPKIQETSHKGAVFEVAASHLKVAARSLY